MVAAFMFNWYDIWQFITKNISTMKNIQKQPSGLNSGAEQQGDNFAESNKNKIQGDNTVKDPDNWKTGDEPMTGAQRSYLNTLASEAGERADEELSKAEASKKIDALQQKTGRGNS
jgi:hypothetical protein